MICSLGLPALQFVNIPLGCTEAIRKFALTEVVVFPQPPHEPTEIFWSPNYCSHARPPFL